MQTFYLVSTELRDPYEPRKCCLVRRLRSELRDDLALIEVEPVLPGHIYDTHTDIRRLIVATRHQESSLFPITEWPVAVYISILKDQKEPEKELIASSDLIILDWGELRKCDV